jgi:hypothetical protein
MSRTVLLVLLFIAVAFRAFVGWYSVRWVFLQPAPAGALR